MSPFLGNQVHIIHITNQLNEFGMQLIDIDRINKTQTQDYFQQNTARNNAYLMSLLQTECRFKLNYQTFNLNNFKHYLMVQ